MNKQEVDLLKILKSHPILTQRDLAKKSGYSLGGINKTIKKLIENGYINQSLELTKKALQLFEANKPQRAIILAAGFGMRMVPINTLTPKALLEVNGETLIERLIKQLQQVGIEEIYIVVGFMKEAFEFLIDQYHVKLIVNTDYATKNNLYSLKLALSYLTNAYIVPCDLWCELNPFDKCELQSWYMVNNLLDPTSFVRLNRKMELVRTSKEIGGNSMIGISYLTQKDGQTVQDNIIKLLAKTSNHRLFWEEALFHKDKMIVQARPILAHEVVEINTYEQLRELDQHSNHLQNDAIEIICQTFNCPEEDIQEIEVLKKGMTNRSFSFICQKQKYIMRIPGEGTSKLINRQEEANVYQVLAGKDICDEVIYMNPENGYKITKYLEDARCCNPLDNNDLIRCMDKLRYFHQQKLTVEHEFDIFEKITFYESLWTNKKSIYKDYEKTKAHIYQLQSFISSQEKEKTLCHIDAVPDNFLITQEENSIHLIDWEYAAMQDPHIDIAMFCIYAMYDKQQCDQLIDIYFNHQCPEMTRYKIYAYIASCGLLWSNWCEYKSQLGVEFGEYSLAQYRYAKEFYLYVVSFIANKKEVNHYEN